MVAKKQKNKALKGKELVKEVCRRIRVARSYWDAHKNAACRGEREKALELFRDFDQRAKRVLSELKFARKDAEILADWFKSSDFKAKYLLIILVAM